MCENQPTLFTNMALNLGKKHLVKLEFPEAHAQLKTAFGETYGKDEEIIAAIEAWEYWQGKVEFSNKGPEAGLSPDHDQYVTEFLKQFTGYAFFSTMIGFKKALLGHLAGLQTKRRTDLSSVRNTFDLLLELKMYQKAEDLLSFYVGVSPDKYSLLYHLAQAQCLNGNKDAARGNYARAILTGPDERFIKRIVDDEFLNIVRLHGIFIAPAYGMLHYRSFSVAINPEIEFMNEAHKNGFQAYMMVRKLKFSKDMKEETAHRKKLKVLSPDLFRAYMGLKH